MKGMMVGRMGWWGYGCSNCRMCCAGTVRARVRKRQAKRRDQREWRRSIRRDIDSL